jgi:hypothetical protein
MCAFVLLPAGVPQASHERSGPSCGSAGGQWRSGPVSASTGKLMARNDTEDACAVRMLYVVGVGDARQ